jgi:uncharacterized protein
MKSTLQIVVLPGAYVVAQLKSIEHLSLPSSVDHAMYSLTLTHDECSFVGPEVLLRQAMTVSGNWRCLRVDGDLAFDQVGVVSTISAAIAAGGISLLAISSHDRDHFLVQESNLQTALGLLAHAGCDIHRHSAS